MAVEIMETRNGATIKLSQYQGIQADLLEQGYKLDSRNVAKVKPGHFVCPKCAGEVGIDMVFGHPVTKQERGFVLCMGCYHVTKLIFIYGEESS